MKLAIASSLIALVGILSYSSADAARQAVIVALVSHDSTPYTEVLDGFRDYVGSRFQTDLSVNTLDPETQRFPEGTIRQKKPHLVFAVGHKASEAAAALAPTVPVVATMVIDAHDLARPNVTGVTLDFPARTSLPWVKKLLPNHTRIGVLFDPEKNTGRVQDLIETARDLKLQIETREVRSPKELPSALKDLSRITDALWAIPDSTVYSSRTAESILLHSFRNRIPLLGISEAWVKAGALFALERDYRDLGVQCGEIAEQLLMGVPPGSIPPIGPRIVRYDLNLKTARLMKVAIPEQIMKEARTLID